MSRRKQKSRGSSLKRRKLSEKSISWSTTPAFMNLCRSKKCPSNSFTMFDVNVLGMLLATQAALKHFNSDGGSIINIGSLASSLTPPTAVVYNATKGAVDAITRTLAKELGPKKIRVNSI